MHEEQRKSFSAPVELIKHPPPPEIDFYLFDLLTLNHNPTVVSPFSAPCFSQGSVAVAPKHITKNLTQKLTHYHPTPFLQNGGQHWYGRGLTCLLAC